MIRIIIALLWAAVLAAFPFVAQAQNSFPTPGGGTVPGVVLMCDNGQHLYVPCTNAPPVITPISIMLSTNSVSFANPANANALVATITVAAMGGVYAGPLALSGTDAAKFALSSSNYPANLMVGASNLATGTYHVSITAGAVTTPFTIAVTVPVATGISLSATSVNFPSATNANANVATITVAATGGTYVGPVTLGGADAAKFALSSGTYPANLLVGAANICTTGSPCTYNISITAAPVTQNFTITVTVSTLTQVFNCPSGFAATGPCSVGFIGSGSGFTFKTVGTNAGTTPAFSGSAVNLVNTAANHVALNFNYQPAAVNVGQFSTTFTFVPDGQGIALILSNNTNAAAANPAAGGNFSGGASCEGAFFQGYTSSSPVNNTFALMLDSYGGNTAGSATFTYSNVQWYDTGHTPPNPPNAPGDDPCNPNPGGALLIPYVGVNKISTSPVALNSPVNTVNTSTGHTYSATVTYDGSNLTINMFDVTAGGACPGAACFTNTWTGVNIPTVVGGSTAWVGLGGATGTIVNPSPLLINGWTYSSN